MEPGLSQSVAHQLQVGRTQELGAEFLRIEAGVEAADRGRHPRGVPGMVAIAVLLLNGGWARRRDFGSTVASGSAAVVKDG